MVVNVDYAKWLQKGVWTVREAINLAIELDADFLLDGKHAVHGDVYETDVPDEADQHYHEIEELVRRSLISNDLPHTKGLHEQLDIYEQNNKMDSEGFFVESQWADKIYLKPLEFLTWAKRKHVSLPANLLEAIQPTEEPLNKKERNSLLKLFIGIAAVKYTSESLLSEKANATKISSDILSASGISINDDTVRSYLREALKLLKDAVADKPKK